MIYSVEGVVKGEKEFGVENSQKVSLPASIATVWGRRARPAKGPKQGLSVAQIVDTAITIADTEGLGAVTMARVANRLGTGAMSLYRYVATKDELFTLMLDAALGQPPASLTAAPDWRRGLSAWAWATRAVLYQHLWVVRIPVSGPPTTPNQLRWLDAALRPLQNTALHDAEKPLLVLLLNSYIRSEASLVADLAVSTAPEPTEIMTHYNQFLAEILDPHEFPALVAAVHGGAFANDEGADREFAFSLERILDGIGVLIEARKQPVAER